MKPHHLILPIFCCIIFNKLQAGIPSEPVQYSNQGHWYFMENKGQVTDENKNPVPEIKFYGRQGGVSVYCKPGAISFSFSREEKSGAQISEATGRPIHDNLDDISQPEQRKPSKINVSRADLELTGSNPNAQILSSDRQDYFENYFTTGDANKGITGIHAFNTLTYKDIYPHIDLVLHTGAVGMKYEFVVYPGGRVADIRMQWNGLEQLRMLKNGSVNYAIRGGFMTECAPYSFQDQSKVGSEFSIQDNTIGFNVESYDKTKILTIDPTLNWATYYGNSMEYAGTQEKNIGTDGKGNVYICGTTSGSTLVATSGAYQTSLASSYDAFISKFNDKGNLLWATYYGGPQDDMATDLARDDAGNMYVSGYTWSSYGIATSGAFQTKFGGGSGGVNGFLAKFRPNGTLGWSTYFNGDGFAVAFDKSGNVFVAGNTSFTANIATSGAYQTSFGGVDDGLLAKFDSTGSKLLWATYFGGKDRDDAEDLAIDNEGNVFIAGYTLSNAAIATKGTFQTFISGQSDAFIAKFNTAGTLLWSTYYGGYSNELCYGIALDHSGNPYITGRTSSSTSIATGGAFQTSYNGGGFDAFLAKFNSDGTKLLWGTYFGGTGLDFAGAVITDSSGNIYISGQTGSSSGIATSNGYKTAYNSGIDAFLARFSCSGSLQYATYYGGNGDEYQAGMTNTGNGNMYITGTTSSTTGIATSGAYQTALSGNWKNVYLVKYSLPVSDDAGIRSISSPGTIICEGALPVKIFLKNYGLNALDSVKLGWKVNNKVQKTVNVNSGKIKPDSGLTISLGTYNFAPGVDTVVAWISSINGNTDSFPGNDTLSLIVNVSGYPKAFAGKDTSMCIGGSATLGGAAIKGHTYAWTSKPSGLNSTLSKLIVSPPNTTTYYLTEVVIAGHCSRSDSVVVKINPLPTAFAGTDQTVCQRSRVILGQSAVIGHSYSWSSIPAGFSSSLADPAINPDSTATYVLTEKINATGCTSTDTVTITTKITPKTSVTGLASVCKGIPASYQTKGFSGDKYAWTVTNGTITSGSSTRVVSVNWNSSATGGIKVIEYSQDGCSDSSSLDVKVHEIPSAKTISGTAICADSSINIGANADTGNTYAWTSSPAGYVSTSPNPAVNPSATTVYYLRETDTITGCYKINSVKIVVNPKPVPAFTYTDICPGDSTPFRNKTDSAISYRWDFGDGDSSAAFQPKHLYAGTGTYQARLKAITSSGCSAATTGKVVISACVWPGDANNDKTVDMKDFLAIAKAYGTKGHRRPSASTNWTGQPSTDWSSAFKSGVNYKHADCNGDSIVNYNDTIALVKNYGKSHPKSGVLDQGNPADPPCLVKYPQDTFYAGDTVKAELWLGDQNKNIQNIYGLKFSVNADPAIFETEKAFLQLNTSFLGNPGTEVLGMKIYNAGNGIIDIGISRINQQDGSGFGNVATLYIPLKTKLPKEYNLTSLILSDNLQLSFNEQKVPLYFTSDTILAKQDHTGMKITGANDIAGLQIYPNPFSASTTLEYNLKKESDVQISLTDITGKQTGIIADEKQHTGNYHFEINADKFNIKPGIYLLKFMIDGQVVCRDIVKY
jgi:hypothetical protein